ncbi:helix-turn-helix domain-containing protein [Paenibacillus polymyxa]|uniref:Helix-turn-helix transcriptional regulator n=1 Tax=Paenibacillus polymyxa TaxID=1406 RepID=A0AAP4EDB0_PAEPO|nr:helix-turn-helix transcriptional regulator [Paenibacillus polymyxa]MDH2334248.1 helix-turn-helix transcriptional regulator [Paenibacillus polymyxa]
MERAKVISRLIEEKGYSRRAFAESVGIPSTTLQSMLTRGVGGAAIDNVLKVTKGLGITIDELEKLASGEGEGSVLEAAEIAEFEAFIKNPEHGIFFKDYLEAPEARKRELMQFWKFIQEKEKNRKPGDQQGE